MHATRILVEASSSSDRQKRVVSQEGPSFPGTGARPPSDRPSQKASDRQKQGHTQEACRLFRSPFFQEARADLGRYPPSPRSHERPLSSRASLSIPGCGRSGHIEPVSCASSRSPLPRRMHSITIDEYGGLHTPDTPRGGCRVRPIAWPLASPRAEESRNNNRSQSPFGCVSLLAMAGFVGAVRSCQSQ